MAENESLIKNLEAQLNRLVAQLQDLEEIREELDGSEWEEMKQDTLIQIQDFNDALVRITSGNISLESTVSRIKQDLRKAISASFNTTDMIKALDNKECISLEQQLGQIDVDFRAKRITEKCWLSKKGNLLSQLRKAGKELTEDQEAFVNKVYGELEKIE